MAETIGQEMELETEIGGRIGIGTKTGIGERIGIGTETGIGGGTRIGINIEVAAGPDPEMEVMIEGLNIAVGMQDNVLNVYSVLYTFIYLILLNLFNCPCHAGGITFFNQ